MTSLPDPLKSVHRYIANAEADVREMLGVIGIESVDRLFDSIPNDVKLTSLLDIPGPWSEIEARRWREGELPVHRPVSGRGRTSLPEPQKRA